MNSYLENNYKGNILVVDDSPDNLRFLSTSLTAIGYKVRCVTSGQMALISIRSSRPDLILLDIRMPVLDGYEVCQRIKNDPKTKDIPIIFLSAIDEVADKVKAFELGGADYVTKPFQTDEILARIANQLTIRRLQNQLAAQNQQLQQEIDAHKRTEAALQDAKEAAEIANYAKSNFIAKMSHELRTPLNTILGFSGLMGNDASLSEEHQDYVLRINQSARSLLQTINQILSITRKESNQISLNLQNFSLRSLLDDVASNWQLQAHKKGLKFDFSCASNIPEYIRSDDGKLRQILIHLLKNAVHFTDSGRVSLQVNVEDSHWEEGAPLKVSEHDLFQEVVPLFFRIEDTGSGIASHEMARLFQAFSQTEAGQKTEQGLGLGLYISYQYIQAMGGNINISSTPGLGTEARFYVLAQPLSPDLVSSAQIRLMDTDMAGQISPAISVISLNTAEKLIIEALGTDLSVDWVTKLNKAAIQGFDQQITRLIQDIPATYLSLSGILEEWNKNFQFDQIITITQRILKEEL